VNPVPIAPPYHLDQILQFNFERACD